MYDCFGLTPMVTHACNMRCSYCYAGARRERPMALHVGRRAIDRSLSSLQPGGSLDLGFFGGEPLLRASLVARLMDHAQESAAARGVRVRFSITTNGTVSSPDAWALMVRPGVNLAVSFDGLPEVHDRHRTFADGRGSSPPALRTIRRLLDAGVDFRTVAVVTPHSVARMPAGSRGCTRIDADWTYGEQTDGKTPSRFRSQRLSASAVPRRASHRPGPQATNSSAHSRAMRVHSHMRCGSWRQVWVSFITISTTQPRVFSRKSCVTRRT